MPLRPRWLIMHLWPLYKPVSVISARQVHNDGDYRDRMATRQERNRRLHSPPCSADGPAVNARRKPNKRRPTIPVTPPANRDRSATKFVASLRRRRRAHEVALADLDAALPDDIVGSGGMKPEVWQIVSEQ